MMASLKNSLENMGVFKDFSDGSIKSVFKATNKGIIELTLLFNKPNIDVICVPTHHFCNLGCKMCHLTNKGLNKHMQPIGVDDILEAIVKSACYNIESNTDNLNYDSINSSVFERRTTKDKLLISYMGVGEPLLNLNLIEQIYLHEDLLKKVLGYSEISYALSTMMPNDNVKKLTEIVLKNRIPVKLHFSMHSPYNNERFRLIPSAKTTIEEAFLLMLSYKKALLANQDIMEKYIHFHKTTEPIEIHYTLIKGENDSISHLNETVKLLSKHEITIKFIRFNPINNLEVSDMENTWVKTIKNEIPNIRVKTYSPPGREIGSSCGEFTKHYYHEEIETFEQLQDFNEWENTHRIYENYRRNFISWDEYYMGVALLSSMRSKDPSTQVGACIVSKNKRILSVGYNGTPNEINDEQFNWGKGGNSLNNKYAYVIHAEANAILNFSGNTGELVGSTLYVTLFPCNECAKFVVQSGIKNVIYLSDKYHNKQETIVAKKLFDKCNIEYSKFSARRMGLEISYSEK